MATGGVTAMEDEPVVSDGLVGKTNVTVVTYTHDQDMYIALAFSISFALLILIALCWCYWKQRRKAPHPLVPPPTERSKEIINYFVPSMSTSKVRLTEDLNDNTVPWQDSLNNTGDCEKDKQHHIDVDSHTDGSSPFTSAQVRRQSVNWPARLSKMRRGQCMERYSIHTTQLTRSQYDAGLDISLSDDEHSSHVASYSLGRICFSLSYVDTLGVLYVIIRRAQHLMVRPRRSHVNPYVKLALLPEKKPRYTTKVHRKTSSPVFEESFIFSVEKEELENHELKITVQDHERIGRRHKIGHVRFSLVDMKNNLDADCHEDIWRDIITDPPQSRDYRGELLVTLTHRPADSCLELTIIRGRYLAMQDGEVAVGGVYIQMSLMVSEKLWKIKHTHTEYEAANPIFDHELSVHLSALDLEQTNIVLAAYGKTATGACRLIGCVTLGPYKYTSGPGMQHWREMLNSPNMDSSMWHTLS